MVVHGAELNSNVENCYNILIDILQDMEDSGADWEELIFACLTAAAFCAAEGDYGADNFMKVVRGIKVTDEGYHGDA